MQRARLWPCLLLESPSHKRGYWDWKDIARVWVLSACVGERFARRKHVSYTTFHIETDVLRLEGTGQRSFGIIQSRHIAMIHSSSPFLTK